MDECSFSLLPVTSCSHCTTQTDGLPADPAHDRTRSFVARYSGACAGRCGWPVEPGERVRYDRYGRIVHARCG